VRVVLVSSALQQPTRGNHTTIQRWMRFVQGVDLVLVPATTPVELGFTPDLVDGYHAIHGGHAAKRLADRYGVPLVVNLGGTDLFACLKGDAAVERVLLAAAYVTGAFPEFGERLREHFGRAINYATVPRGVPIPADLPPREPHDTLRVLLPSGLRPVKDVLLAIDLGERLRTRGLPIELRILGPAMDRHYARRVRERAKVAGFVTIDEMEPERMHDAYFAADVVWNTSVHEGGSNALLEAVAHGCAIFARDIPGNQEMLHEAGAAGVLFRADDTDLAESFHRALLAEDAEARQARVAKGLKWLRERHDPVAEARAIEAVWRKVL